MITRMRSNRPDPAPVHDSTHARPLARTRPWHAAALASGLVLAGALAYRLANVEPALLGLAHASGPRNGRIVKVAHERPDMAYVPAGEFVMGPSGEELQSLDSACRIEMGYANHFCSQDAAFNNLRLRARDVFLDAFYIDRYEITAGEFRKCIAAGACRIRPLVAGDERFIRDDWPMVNVTWQDAVDYCTFAGKRLPTEAEWEKAARGVNGYRWPWGNHDRQDGANHGASQSSAMQVTRAYQYPVRVGNRIVNQVQAPVESVPDDRDGYLFLAPPGALKWSDSPYGVYDMAGNAGEWVQDYFSIEGYEGLSQVNPVRAEPDPSGIIGRVVRGGSWLEPKFFARTYFRYAVRPDWRSADIGFRCARSAE